MVGEAYAERIVKLFVPFEAPRLHDCFGFFARSIAIIIRLLDSSLQMRFDN
jgi:hypothetical protein